MGRFRDGIWYPNAAALLLHGKSPQDLFPGAKLELVRYGGLEHDAPVVARRTATGTLQDQLEVSWAWLRSHIEDRPLRPDGIREGFVPSYPEEALKEFVRNMVQHRLYEGTHAPGRIE